MAELVAAKMRALRMEVRQIEPEPNRVSDWGLIRGSEGDRTLLYDAHLDTVPVGDPAAWIAPPFEARILDGRMIGRGATDCKQGIAAPLEALRAIQMAGIALRGNCMMTFTADEETGGHLGISTMIEQGWVQADYCFYGEGWPDRLTLGARGLCQVEITVEGKSVHTSRKQTGINAILKMLDVIPVIETLTYSNWQPHPVLPGDPYGSVNLIRGGVKENVVPDRCTITVDIRFLPGMSVKGVLADVEAALDRLRAKDADLKVSYRPVSIARPVFISPDAPFVRLMSAAVKDVTGKTPVLQGMVGSSDSRWLVHDAKIPTINYSMGNNSSHQPNEYILVDEYIDNIKVCALMALLLIG
jgi:succinyl-diaminopimelate desuccinylase